MQNHNQTGKNQNSSPARNDDQRSSPKTNNPDGQNQFGGKQDRTKK